MTKQEILDKFNDIDFVYNDSSKHDTLSRMLDELLKGQEAVVLCKDCKYRPELKLYSDKRGNFTAVKFPEGSKCPCQCDDPFYSWYPSDEWFCADGEWQEVK